MYSTGTYKGKYRYLVVLSEKLPFFFDSKVLFKKYNSTLKGTGFLQAALLFTIQHLYRGAGYYPYLHLIAAKGYTPVNTKRQHFSAECQTKDINRV